MNYNEKFEDLMDEINNIGKGYGFKNGIDWAMNAHHNGEIGWAEFKNFENAHNLRVRFSHGNARDISVSYETYDIVKRFKNRIQASNYRKHRNVKSNLPYGGFRYRPFVKEFRRVGADGEQYTFRFTIKEETNYLDDGKGGTYGHGYFIHINSAPYFNYSSERLHDFHMIKTNEGYHICWNKVINQFDAANAVMMVWVNRYCDLIDVLKRDRNIGERELLAKANKRNVLPTGTFRYKNQRKSYHKKIYIYKNVYNKIMNDLGTSKPERGGMLGFSIDQNTIDNYVFDKKAKVTEVEYNPDLEYLQNILDNEWKNQQVFLAGFVHSHPGDFNRLSYDDIEYAKKIMKEFEMDYIFMPIVTSSYSYKKSLCGYVVYSNGKVEKCSIYVVPGENKKTMIDANTISNQTSDNFDTDLLKSIEAEFDRMSQNRSITQNNLNYENNEDNISETFSRISSVIDINHMKNCSVIGIGCGGARSFYESMARVGVGNFYLMDGDKISYSNIASQNGYISEVGKYKTQVIKERLLDIDTTINVKTFECMLNGALADEFLEEEIINKVKVENCIICAFTDDFFAQARISRIALKYKIPFICAQHHKFGNTSEIIFWYPGITKYSLREIARSRYLAFENGYTNMVTSNGSPIFNTTRLNAISEKLATGMLLYNKYPNHKYSSFLNKMNDKNLILIKQVSMNQDNPFYDLFNNSINDCFDEVTWINPECLEDLSNIELEENNVGDTRNIFI